MVRSQVEEQLPGLPQYHFRFLDGSGDVKEMRGSVPVAPQQEASELAEHTAYLALGPARTAVSRDAEVLTAGDAPNPFVRGFARGVYAAECAAATKRAAAAALFDRPTIASEMRKLQISERAARNRELSEREVKLSPASPARTAAGGAPHGNSTSDDGPASLCIVYV